MNKTIVSIEVQDYGRKDATIIVRGKRNNQILFKECFDYKDEKIYPLRIHFLKDDFMEKYLKLGDSLGVHCIRKLFEDITKRSKMKSNPDYRELHKNKLIFEDYILQDSIELHGRKEIEDFFKDEPEGCRLKEFVDWLLFQPDGTAIGLPYHYEIGGREVVVPRKAKEVVIYHT